MTSQPAVLMPARSADEAAPAEAAPAPAGQLVDKSVIHDLRNPLSAMGGNLQLLQAALESNLDEKNRSRLQACMGSLEELTGMLTDLQYLTLFEAGELEPTYKPVDVRAIVGAVVRALIPKAAQDGRDLTVLESATPCVPAAAVLLQRAVQNLVVSALRVCKASPVTVQVLDAPGQHAEVVVSYQGLSVPSPVCEHLFDLHCGHTQQRHGLRVDRSRGLYLARTVAELHGGGVRYLPTEAGGRFILRLPHHHPTT